MTIDQNLLQQVYQQRPDLQAVYNPDGTAKNANDPRVAGIPTLLDWANTFGIKEVPSLDPTYASLSKYYSPQDISGMDPQTRTALAAFIDVQTKAYDTGKANADINAANWNDAMKAATNDPEIVAKYGDELKSAAENTTQALTDISSGYTEQQAATARQQTLDTKNLNEAAGAAGTAYSGFRKQAQEKLAADQNDVITSSKRQLQDNLNNVLQPYEQRYGSAGLNGVKIPTVDGETYTPLGLTGTQSFDKANDIESKATDLYNNVTPTTTETTNPKGA